MDKDYNVDDILQEIHKKKKREDRQRTDAKPSAYRHAPERMNPVQGERRVPPIVSEQHPQSDALPNRRNTGDTATGRQSVYSTKARERSRHSERSPLEESWNTVPAAPKENAEYDPPFKVTQYERAEPSASGFLFEQQPAAEPENDVISADSLDAYFGHSARETAPKSGRTERPLQQEPQIEDKKSDIGIPSQTGMDDGFLFDILEKPAPRPPAPMPSAYAQKQPAELHKPTSASKPDSPSPDRQPRTEWSYEPRKNPVVPQDEISTMGNYREPIADTGPYEAPVIREQSSIETPAQNQILAQPESPDSAINHPRRARRIRRPVQRSVPEQKMPPQEMDGISSDNGFVPEIKEPAIAFGIQQPADTMDIKGDSEQAYQPMQPFEQDIQENRQSQYHKAQERASARRQMQDPLEADDWRPKDGFLFQKNVPSDSTQKNSYMPETAEPEPTQTMEYEPYAAPAEQTYAMNPDPVPERSGFDDLFSFGTQGQEAAPNLDDFSFFNTGELELDINQSLDSQFDLGEIPTLDEEENGEPETIPESDQGGKRRKRASGGLDLDSFEGLTDLQMPGLDEGIFGPNASLRDSRSKGQQNPLQHTYEIQEEKRGKRRRKKSAAPKVQSDQEQPWQQSYAVQELLVQKTPSDDELSSPEDIPYVGKELRTERFRHFLRFVAMLILTPISVYLALCFQPVGTTMLTIPDFIRPEVHTRLYLIVSLFVFLGAVGVCFPIISNGLVGLFTLKANADSPVSLATLGVLVQTIYLLIAPVEIILTSDSKASRWGNIHIYMGVACVLMLFNLIGKLMMLYRVERNFVCLVSKKEKYAFLQIKNRDFAREFSRGLGPDVDKVAYSVKSAFMPGFLEQSYAPDYSIQFTKLIVPISLVGAIIVGVVTGILNSDGLMAVSAAAAVLCITAPFSGTIMPNLMLSIACSKLTKNSSYLSGYETAEDLSETGSVILYDRDLFQYKNVMLHGMKVFAEKRVDEAILDAASVTLSCDSILAGIFMNMIGGNKELLRTVENLVYEDSMGLSAWVSGKRVLIGNRDLMQTHNIDYPSHDFESKYAKNGRQALYIANSGELTAMFIVSYNADPLVADTLAKLESRGIYPVIYTTDPNITSSVVSDAFGIKRTHVKIMPVELHEEYNMITKPKERVTTGSAHAGGLFAISRLLTMARAVKRSVMTGTILQLISIIVAYGLVAFMALVGSLSTVNCQMLLFYGGVSLGVTILASLLVKR